MLPKSGKSGAYQLFSLANYVNRKRDQCNGCKKKNGVVVLKESIKLCGDTMGSTMIRSYVDFYFVMPYLAKIKKKNCLINEPKNNSPIQFIYVFFYSEFLHDIYP